MSALGQKQTSELVGRCPLCPQKRTLPPAYSQPGLFYFCIDSEPENQILRQTAIDSQAFAVDCIGKTRTPATGRARRSPFLSERLFFAGKLIYKSVDHNQLDWRVVFPRNA